VRELRRHPQGRRHRDLRARGGRAEALTYLENGKAARPLGARRFRFERAVIEEGGAGVGGVSGYLGQKEMCFWGIGCGRGATSALGRVVSRRGKHGRPRSIWVFEPERNRPLRRRLRIAAISW